MTRPLPIVKVLFAGLILFVVAAAFPEDASAHVAVHDTVEVVPDAGADEPEPHCHGEIECVVTLYPASSEDMAPMSNPPMVHTAVRDTASVGTAPQHDPPIPILT